MLLFYSCPVELLHFSTSNVTSVDWCHSGLTTKLPKESCTFLNSPFIHVELFCLLVKIFICSICHRLSHFGLTSFQQKSSIFVKWIHAEGNKLMTSVKEVINLRQPVSVGWQSN